MLAERQRSLKVVATTVTRAGQVLDWVTPESQTPDGRMHTPPSFDGPPPLDTRLHTELEEQPEALGPAGTVPVLRLDPDLIEAQGTPESFFSKYPDGALPPEASDEAPPQDAPVPNHKYAYSKQSVPNIGGDSYMNVWAPYVENTNDFSLSQVSVSAPRSDGKLQTVEAGWHVYPRRTGDSSPHLFTYFNTNGYAYTGNNAGGYNRDYTGWVQYGAYAYPGALLVGSTYGGTQYDLHLQYQYSGGAWWLQYQGTWIGYYPSSLFSYPGLNSSATAISYYGEVYDYPDGVTTATYMGDGVQPQDNLLYSYTAYQRNLTYRDITTGALYRYNPGTYYATASGCYKLYPAFASSGSFATHFFFGGVGRSFYCP